MLLLGGCAAAECGVSDAAAGLTGVAELVSLEVVGAVRRVVTGLAREPRHGHASMRQGPEPEQEPFG